METIPAFYFERANLRRLAEENRDRFRAATPFEHVAIDDFLPADIVRRLVDEFPGPDEIEWVVAGPGDAKHTASKYIEKISTSDEEKFPPLIRHLLSQLNSGVFISFLESLTGIRQLAADPSYYGCGMHSTGSGGRLMIHSDASRHPDPRFHQRLNLILYLNPGWEEEWGGHFELWNADATRLEKRILPIVNRCVVFSTGSSSYHGHPHPLRCPVERRRNSLAVYYYTVGRKFDENYTHWRNYVDWVRTQPEDRPAWIHRAKSLIRKTAPPPWISLGKRVKDRLRRKLF